MITKWIINEPKGKRKGCLIALPGRNISADNMERFCQYMELENTLTVCLEPEHLEWYPQPNGADDQEAAVEGIDLAVKEINNRISKVQRTFRFRRQQIALVGFSAGSVMALQVVA